MLEIPQITTEEENEDEFIKFREQNEMDMHSENPYLSPKRA